jgi:flagellar biosynthesis protein FlhA
MRINMMMMADSSSNTGGGFNLAKIWASMMRHNDVFLSVGMLTIILMMILPLPPMLLDLLLTLNLALSLTIFLVTLYTREPLQYSTFPTLLLVSTLFRLGLNVSSTRLILLTGSAGDVIQAFGNFVVGGNYVVGLLIFIILMIINFMVITNGAGRVSEVSARFTLDALPGKQLSIDADLNSGMIDEKEAKRRRNAIQKEADFYGTMDGASKFVKGDAIAGIIITVINIIFGLIVGVVQLGMEPMEAASTFTILTVGDGLVSSLPALIISASTGILVTRVSEHEDRSLGDELGHQLLSNYKVLGVMGALLIVIGLVPGMPTIPFLFIGGLAGVGTWFQFKRLRNEEVRDEAQRDADATAATLKEKTKKSSTEEVLEMLQIEPMELELGYRLVPLIESDSTGDLLERIANIRKQVAQEYGVVLPSIRVRDNLHIEADSYQLKLRGITIGQGKVMADMLMAMATDPMLADEVQGIPTTEPAFGLPALWIEKSDKDDAELNGYTVIHPGAVLATHITELVKGNLAQLLTRQDVKQLLDNLKKTSEAHESLVDDLIPSQLSISELHVVLQLLLMEHVSIRDLTSLLESISYHHRISKAPEYLVEQARVAISRHLCKQHVDDQSGKLPVLTLAPEVEETMANHLLNTGTGADGQPQQMLALNPQYTQQLLATVNQQIEDVLTNHGVQPVILCNGRLRCHVRKLIERMLPQVAVMSYNEIGPSTQVQTYGSIHPIAS